MEALPDIFPFQNRYEELTAEMGDPAFFNNPRHAADVGREHQRLAELLESHERYRKLQINIDEAVTLSKDAQTDAELQELAAEELPEMQEELAGLEASILGAMIPTDPTDSRDTVVEIRAGTGGDEASLFAGELYRVYAKYSERMGWRIQPMSSSPTERGGMKEVIFLITGTDVYRQLKYESGVHRVQRVPVTEANSRIHTSTITVAVLPEAEEVDIEIDPQDLDISVCRASGPGGQGVNTTDSAVQIIYKPTGLIVVCSDERSQIKNRARAMTVLRSRLLQQKQDEEKAKYASERRDQIGSGDRSERIRTYNFPQNRLTDHRIGLTLQSLPLVMEGEIDDVITALQRADHAQKLAALSEKQF